MEKNLKEAQILQVGVAVIGNCQRGWRKPKDKNCTSEAGSQEP
jgi:hypothetical protein